MRRIAVAAAFAIALAACSGTSGKDGLNGKDGANGINGTNGQDGANGTNGATGATGADAVTTGTIRGTVKSAAGTPIAGVSISTVPASVTATSASDGTFQLGNVAIGSYAVVATQSGYATYSLSGVGVASATTTSINLTMTAAPLASGSITGKVVDTAGVAREGVTVTAVGTNPAVTAVTDLNGNYTLSGLTGGSFYFVETSATTDKAWLAGGTRSSVGVFAPTNKAADIVVSARPTDAATYVGGAMCELCHGQLSAGIVGSVKASAHARSLTTPATTPAAPLGRMITTAGLGNVLWPAATGPGNKLSFTTLCADGATAGCTVYACNLAGGSSIGTAAKSVGFKFVKPADAASPTAADCTVTTDGAVVPVSGTYGGEGDRYPVTGGTEKRNLGVFKQRFFAALSDVPSTTTWTNYPAADQARDWVVFPIQITQPGGQFDVSGTMVNGGARFAPYGALQNSWSKRGETFAQQCASCHNVGLQLAFDANGDVTSYDYKDFNISCEHCHGPGSEHAARPGKAKSIINPVGLTALDEVRLCGKCHAADAATMKAPFGAGEMPWNADRAGTIGNGGFIAGIHDIRDYIANWDGEVTLGGVELEAGFVTWADGKHGQPHRQQGKELEHSIHMNNPYERVTCAECHSVHSAYQGPYSVKVTDSTSKSTYDLHGTRFNDNTVCLRCHANFGPFAGIAKEDVAAVVASSGGQVFANGATTATVYTTAQMSAAKMKIADEVVKHMNTKAGMGLQVIYQPENDAMPVGRCASCHMAKTGKSGGYAFVQNSAGERAMLEGDEASHYFDVVYPADAYDTYLASQAIAKPTTGADNRYQSTMPNACAKCHDESRFFIK